MTALEVAQAYGMPLRQKGGKHWACCPLHGEKTPSLCFFPDGRWYCFGCHRHGDAADLYAALYGVSIGEALKAVKGDTRARSSTPRKQTASDLRRNVEAWKGQQWAAACIAKHEATARMNTATSEDAFWQEAGDAATAEDTLNLLDSASPAQLLKMMAEENVGDELRTGTG